MPRSLSRAALDATTRSGTPVSHSCLTIWTAIGCTTSNMYAGTTPTTERRGRTFLRLAGPDPRKWWLRDRGPQREWWTQVDPGAFKKMRFRREEFRMRVHAIRNSWGTPLKFRYVSTFRNTGMTQECSADGWIVFQPRIMHDPGVRPTENTEFREEYTPEQEQE